MPISNETQWKACIESNEDDYGAQCVEVARHLMDLLDDESFELTTCHAAINRADDMTDDPGITGFMVGAVSNIVSKVHSRGEEWRKKWNTENQIRDEGDKANEGKGVLNPALLTIKC